MRLFSGLFRKVNDISLNYKFSLIYLLCVLVPIISINVMFFEQVSRNIQVREERNLQITMDRSVRELRDILLGAVTLSHSISVDRSFYEKLDLQYEDTVAYYEALNSGLRDKMTPFLSAYPYVDTIGIYTDNPTIESGGNYFFLSDSVRRSVWYEQMQEARGPIGLYVHREQHPMNAEKKKTYFSVVREMREYPIYNTYRKWLKIDINIGRIEQLMNQDKMDLNLSLIDPNGRIVFSTNQPKLLENETFPLYDESRPAEEGQSIVFERLLGEANYFEGWRLVGTADPHRISAALFESRKFIWIVAIVSTFVPTALIVIILRSYNDRIKRLLRHMTKVKNGKFDLIETVEGKDEIGGLIRSFNLMTKKIHSLIHDVYELEIQKKDLELESVRAEMNLLQSQMNPHFLFNTLNALLVVSAKNKYTDITEIIRNLSLLLRRLIDWTEDLVPLREELHFTEMYLQIEKFRFSDRFDYTIRIDEGAELLPVPKMCVQTLVENACKHGLQAVRGMRQIRVDVKIVSSYMIVEVEDNGIGMSSEKLNSIKAKMRKARGNGEGIGLRNVYQRLRLYYDDRVDFRIDSEPNGGTKVMFRMPIRSQIQEKGELPDV
ncbi:sensor histidine kinase [Paenibacillus xylaniclasticus]|uniref:sensor histidine kinase n=1 Tax=Paenibacillus xylaniclasticus TaxID=588083 RepID=UPI000FD801F1|nr:MULTISPECIES: histidine kinase [Paenibacillus]GFN30174.1 histidine kinase [Paenibacillus curdlanolyticus]